MLVAGGSFTVDAVNNPGKFPGLFVSDAPNSVVVISAFEIIFGLLLFLIALWALTQPDSKLANNAVTIMAAVMVILLVITEMFIEGVSLQLTGLLLVGLFQMASLFELYLTTLIFATMATLWKYGDSLKRSEGFRILENVVFDWLSAVFVIMFIYTCSALAFIAQVRAANSFGEVEFRPQLTGPLTLVLGRNNLFQIMLAFFVLTFLFAIVAAPLAMLYRWTRNATLVKCLAVVTFMYMIVYHAIGTLAESTFLAAMPGMGMQGLLALLAITFEMRFNGQPNFGLYTSL